MAASVKFKLFLSSHLVRVMGCGNFIVTGVVLFINVRVLYVCCNKVTRLHRAKRILYFKHQEFNVRKLCGCFKVYTNFLQKKV